MDFQQGLITTIHEYGVTSDLLKELNKRLKKIESIENIYVQQLNNKYVFVKLKYFGKLNKIIKQLSDQNILLQFSEDQWSLKIS